MLDLLADLFWRFVQKNESRTAQAVGCTGLAVLLFAAFMAAYSAYYPDGRAAGEELLLRVGGGHGVGDDLHLAHRLLLVGYKLLGKVAIGGEACAGGDELADDDVLLQTH